MRPLELSLRGFRSYRDLATFDWRGRRLVGIVGPIGSGKSSVLDAVAFSLFGKTPTFERDTKSLINQLSDECHVELRFEVDGQVWRAVRALRRKGSSGHQLERLAGDGPAAEVVESIVGEKLMRQRVEQLLGMDFDAFCRSVLLAQNRFSEFLRATPTQRNDVLKGVFGYERFDAAHGAAKVRLATAEQTAASLEDERGRLSQVREQLAAAETDHAAATARADGLRSARARMDELAETRRLAADRVARSLDRLSQLKAVTDAAPDEDHADEVVGTAVRAGETLERADRAAAEAEAARVAAETAYAAVVDRMGDQAHFAALVRSMEHLARAAEERAKDREGSSSSRDLAVEAAREAEAAAREADERRDAASADLAAAEAGVVDAEHLAHDARHADMAMTLRTTLEAGATCPVCEQLVPAPPAVVKPGALEDADAALTEARRVAEGRAAAAGSATADAASAQARVAAASEHVARTETELARATELLDRAEAELSACQSSLVDQLGTGDPQALLAERAAELESAEHHRAETVAAASAARDEQGRVRAAAADAGAAMTRIAAQLAAAWGRLGEAREPPDGPEAFRAELSALAEALEEGRETTIREQLQARSDAERADADTARLLRELGLEPDRDFADALTDASIQEATCRERVEGLRETLAAADDIDERAEAATGHLELTRRLAADLQPSRFLAFLLEEERAALGELGSVHLDELTDGAYRFTDDDRFDVIDLNAAGSERRADSLSGGETFLASLALALALAEMVARGGGRLDAFFLDEGFGSLDPEHLDRAMEGIGRLVAGGTAGNVSAIGVDRLVVLVSHVEQMRQMVEDLIVLDKDALTGDTIVRSGAAPAWPATRV